MNCCLAQSQFAFEATRALFVRGSFKGRLASR